MKLPSRYPYHGRHFLNLTTVTGWLCSRMAQTSSKPRRTNRELIQIIVSRSDVQSRERRPQDLAHPRALGRHLGGGHG